MGTNNMAQGEKIRRKLKVLMAIDASESSNLVIKRTGQFAKVTDCDLTVLNVVEPLGNVPAELPETQLTEFNLNILNVVESLGSVHPELRATHLPKFSLNKQTKAREIVARAGEILKRFGVECKTQIEVGHISSAIVRVAEEGNYDVIFVGSRGLGGFKRMLLGSVADEVIRHAHCAVTVVR